jgi:hypothetical protein
VGLVWLADAIGQDAGKADAERIARLVKQLGSDSFEEREKATRELEEIGSPALAALRGVGKEQGAEARTRAAGLIERIEKKRLSGNLLAPTRVKLAFKDTPIKEAVAEFSKKSGYNIRLHDPDQKLNERTITLDSGDTTFWEALDQFCDTGGVAELGVQELMTRLGPGGAGAQSILLTDGKRKPVPTCYSGAVRIRAVKEGPPTRLGGTEPAQEDSTTVWLEVRGEPRLQVLTVESAAVKRATDDQGREREGIAVVPGRRGAPAAAPAGQPGSAAAAIQGRRASFGGTHYQAIRLKRTNPDAGALKELSGTISAEVLGTGEPYIVVDKLAKAIGETFKGKEGGLLRVVDFKEEDGRVSLRFELEAPPGVMAANVVSALPPPAPGRGPLGGIVPAPGVSLVDEKGRNIPQTGGTSVKAHFAPGKPLILEYTQEYELDKEQRAAKLVYATSNSAPIDIPFSFKDVPLR